MRVSPTRSYAPLLEEAQQLGLERQRKVADFVEEESPSFGGLDLAFGVGDGAGERAPGMAEELAFEQLGVQAGAAHGDERPGGPAAPGVDRPRQHAFAGAAFPANQDDGVGGGDLVALVEDQRQRRVAAFERRLRHLADELLLEPGELVFQRTDAIEPLQDGANLGGRERLGQVIERPSAHGVDGVFDAGKGRDDDDGQPRIPRSEGFEQVEARFLTELQVNDRQVEMSSLEVPQRLGNAGASSTLCLAASSAIRRVLRILASSSTIRIRMCGSQRVRRNAPFILVNRHSRSKEATAARVGQGHIANDGPFDFIDAFECVARHGCGHVTGNRLE